MTGSCLQPPYFTEGVAPPLADPGEGGSIYEDVRAILHCGCSGEPVIWYGYSGGDPRMSRTPGGIPPLIGTITHG